MRISDWSSDVCSSDLFLSLGRLDQPAVSDRVGHVRLLRECLVVGLDGVLVAAGARQRIATVVGRIGTGQRLPRTCGAGVILAAVCVGTFLHALVTDLVRAPPQRAVIRGQRLLPRQAGTQQQRREAAAAPEREQPQQHQRQKQPVAVVAPYRGLAGGGALPARRCVEHAERGKITGSGEIGRASWREKVWWYG